MMSFSTFLKTGLFLPLLTLAASGCTTFSPDPLNLWGSKKDVPLDPGKAIVVELRCESEQPKAMPLPHEDGMVVQDALSKSGAIKKFGRMKVSVLRPRPDGKGPHKMEATFDPTKRRVLTNSDYALLPGDRVLVTEDTTTKLDDVVDKIIGPFAAVARKK